MVPLTGANRILVKHGLAELSEANRPGVRALKEVAGLLPGATVTTGQVGFRLGPRINAAGRLDDASVGLSSCAPARSSEARPLAKALDAANAERQAHGEDDARRGARAGRERADRRGLVLSRRAGTPG